MLASQQRKQRIIPELVNARPSVALILTPEMLTLFARQYRLDVQHHCLHSCQNMTITQTSALLKLAQAEFAAGRLSGRDYLIKRQRLQDDLVALVRQADTPLCQHGRAISCTRCPLSNGRCVGRRGAVTLGYT